MYSFVEHDQQAVEEAGKTVNTYLKQAVEMIDQQFGCGYARANPGLVAECVRSQTADFNLYATVTTVTTLLEDWIDSRSDRLLDDKDLGLILKDQSVDSRGL